MIGTIINVLTVAVGSALGLLIGDRLPKNIQQSVVSGLALVTIVVGVQNSLLSGNIIIPLISLIIGVIIGETLNIEKALNDFGGWLQSRFNTQPASPHSTEADPHARERFIQGFITASLVFCVGPLTFIGSLQDGMSGNYQLLAIKATLDGFASLAFAASFGIGVSFSIITIIVVQGGLALVGSLVGNIMTDPMINEMTATGGLLLIGLAIIMLELKPIRVANFLPSLLIAPLIVVIGTTLGIDIYPNFG